MSIAHSSSMLSNSGNPIRTVARTYEAQSVFIITPVTVEATINHLSDGDLTTTFQGDVQIGTPNANEWHAQNPIAGLGDGWEVRYTVTAGDTPNVGGIADGAWSRINATRSIGNTITGASGSRSSTLTLDYRPFSGGPILYTVTGLILTASIV